MSETMKASWRQSPLTFLARHIFAFSTSACPNTAMIVSAPRAPRCASVQSYGVVAILIVV